MTGKIKLNATSGGGSVSFQAPSSTGDDRVITLPTTADGTVLTTTNPKAGNILQVVSTTKTDTFTTTSTSATDITGLSVSITPTSSSNKVLVSYNISGSVEDSEYRAGIILVRDSTEIYIGDAASNRIRMSSFLMHHTNHNYEMFDVSGTHLDSPSSTSAVTYKIQAKMLDSGRQVNINRSYGDADLDTRPRTASSITVMEVAA